MTPYCCCRRRFCAKGSLYGLLHSPGCYLSWAEVVDMLIGAAKGMEHLHANSVLHRCVVWALLLAWLRCSGCCVPAMTRSSSRCHRLLLERRFVWRQCSAVHRMLLLRRRDLKSGNLLVDGDNVVKVADFGLSRLYHGMHTMTGGLGTFQVGARARAQLHGCGNRRREACTGMQCSRRAGMAHERDIVGCACACACACCCSGWRQKCWPTSATATRRTCTASPSSCGSAARARCRLRASTACKQVRAPARPRCCYAHAAASCCCWMPCSGPLKAACLR